MSVDLRATSIATTPLEEAAGTYRSGKCDPHGRVVRVVSVPGHQP
jgi:hypothetical protein